MSPYRRALSRAHDDAPVELVYVPAQRNDSTSAQGRALLMVGPVALVGVALWKLFGDEIAVAGVVLASGISAWRWRRSAKRGIVLRVERGELRVTFVGAREPAFRARL